MVINVVSGLFAKSIPNTNEAFLNESDGIKYTDTSVLFYTKMLEGLWNL